MALSPTHRFGQIICDLLEVALAPLLREFADENGLYLDKTGARRARRGRKVSWIDAYGNTHNLDYVIERDGSETQIGTPVAFIETAWRRYTKHSRNKAQEIQGAILPLVARYQKAVPFIGVILAGDFTSGALTQLKSQGFGVVYFPYDAVMTAFDRVGLNARFDEGTPDAVVADKVLAWQALPQGKRVQLAQEVLERGSRDVNEFMQSLRAAAQRRIEMIVVLPLHGSACELTTVDQAIAFVEDYKMGGTPAPILRYEIEIRFNNGNRYTAALSDKASALQFLREYDPPKALR